MTATEVSHDRPGEVGRSLRRDARANRDRLVEAGRRLLRERGGNLPVEVFCEAAQVTRGTFYRHFPDLVALYQAVLDHELEEMARELAEPDIPPLAFLRSLADMTMVYDRYLSSLPDLPEAFQTAGQEARIMAAIEAPLREAQSDGAMRASVTAEDVLIACRMIGCNWRLDRQPSRAAALDRRLALVLAGLT